MRSMKKLLSSLLIAVMCMAFVAVPAYAVEAEGGEEPTYVAQIVEGETTKQYETLQAAVNALPETGGTITLLDHVNASEVIMLGKSVTIIGNSFSVTSPATRVFRLTASGINVKMQNLTVVSTAAQQGNNDVRGVSVDPGLSSVTLTMESCNVRFNPTAADDWAYGVNVSGSTAGCNINIYGGTYQGANVINIWGNNHNITISGAAINCTYGDNPIYCGLGVKLEGSGSTVNVSSTTFTGSNAAAIAEATPGGNTITESANNDQTTAKNYVRVGDTYQYTSLANAVAVGGNLKLHGDVTLSEAVTVAADQNVTLNLNGKTISVAEGFGGSPIVNNGTLAVSNGYLTFEPGDYIAEGYAAVLVNGKYFIHQHNPELVPTKPHTCTENGNFAYYKCQACGLCYDVVDEKPGDEAYDENQFRDEATHHPATVEAQDSTCTFQGYDKHYECTVCHKHFTDESCTEEIEYLPLADHDTEKHDAVEPDCSSSGNIEYYHCKVCTNLFMDKEATIPTTHEAVTLAPKHTPKYVGPVTATCTEPGNMAHYACKCGSLFKDEAGTQPTTAEAVTTYKDHSYTHVAEVAPTLEAAGNIAHKKCTVCKQLFAVEGHLLNEEDVIIPKLQAATSITMTSSKMEIYEYVGVVVIQTNGYGDKRCNGIVAVPENSIFGDITVTVENPKIAEYIYYEADDYHRIMGLAPGTTTVTVKTESGLTTSFELTVKPVPVLTLGAAEKFNAPAGFMTPFSFASKADGKYRITMDKSDAALALDIFDTTAGPIESTKIDSEDGKFVIEFELKKNKDYAIVIQNFVETEKTGTVTMEMVSHTHNMTKTEAKAATYTDAGNLEYYTCAACSKLFTDAEGKTETTLEKVTIPQMIEVEGTKAEVSEEAMDVAIEAAGTTGNVTLDLTKDEVIGEESAPVSSAVIPVASLEKVAEAGASLTLTKADATVTMDAKALETIAKAAGTGTVTLVVQEVKTEALAVVQQNAVKDKKVAAVISAELINTATNENIGAEADGGFGGGTVTVQIPFTPEEGYKGTDYTVLYVADNGAVTEIKTEYKDGCLVVALDHFSEYVIVNTSYVKPSTGTNPATGDFGMVMPMAIMLLCGIAIAGLIIGKKKYNF